MSHLTTNTSAGNTPTGETTGPHPAPWPRTVLRWMVSSTGFPLGGFAALLLTGPVDDLGAALAGGLVTGAVLGAAQTWALGDLRSRAVAWVPATAVGLAVGLGTGASLVHYRTGLADLVVQGAVTGLGVGIAQAAVLLPRVGAVALAWPVLQSGIWAIGWAVTTAVGVEVDEQFTVFGSAGALVATALGAALPLVLRRAAAGRRS